MTPPKTPAERKAAERTRRHALGLQRLELWLTPDQAASVRAYVARLKAKEKARSEPGTEK